MALTKVSYAMITGAPINVLDYGADSTGATDSTLAIQAAINAGEAVFFPVGSYLISSTISIPSTCKNIFAASQTVTITLNQPSTPAFVDGDPVNGFEISGINFVGSAISTSGPSSVGVAFFNGAPSNIKITNCSFDNFNTGVYVKNGQFIAISNCLFENMIYIPSIGSQGYGVLMEATSFTKIYSNTFLTTVQRHHLYINPGPLGIGWPNSIDHIIENNQFYSDPLSDYITGFEWSLMLVSLQNVNIVGNSFFGGMGHIALDGNPTLNNAPATVADNVFSNVNIVANIFRKVLKGDASNSSIICGLSCTLSGITVSSNTFVDNECENHISLAVVKGGTISNNTINSGLTTARGIEIATSSAADIINVVGNTILNCFDSIFIGRSVTTIGAANILGNYIQAPTGANTGIQTAKSSALCIQNNIVYMPSVATAGIYIIGGDTGYTLVVKNNTIKGAVFGIYAGAGYTIPVWLSGNIIFGQSSLAIQNLTSQPIISVQNNNVVGNDINVVVCSSAAPTTGTWKAGDITWNLNPSPSGFIGFTCVTAGTPGTWKTFGAISA